MILHSLSQWTLKKKIELYFPYGIPKSSKPVSHWLSKGMILQVGLRKKLFSMNFWISSHPSHEHLGSGRSSGSAFWLVAAWRSSGLRVMFVFFFFRVFFWGDVVWGWYLFRNKNMCDFLKVYITRGMKHGFGAIVYRLTFSKLGEDWLIRCE